MGDVRYRRHFEAIRNAPDRGEALRSLATPDLVRALAAASQERDPYLANVIATELERRLARGTIVPDASPAGLIHLDGAGRVTHANEAAERLLGVPRRSLRGTPFDLAWRPLPTGRSQGRDLLAALAGREAEAEGVATFARPGRTPATVEWSLATVRRDGEAVGALVILVDVSPLADQNEDLRSDMSGILEVSREALVGMDEEGIVVFANEAAETLLGCDDLTRSQQTFHERVHPTCLGPACGLAAALASERPSRGRDEIVRADGTMLEVEWSCKPRGGMRAGGGALLSLREARTATGAQAADAALREHLDSLSTLTARLDLEGRFVLAGRAGEVVSGVSRRQAMGTSWVDGAWWAHDPEVHARVARRFAEAVQGRVVRFTERMLAAGGALRYMDVTLTPVTDERGNVRHIIAEGSDVSELIEAQMALRRRERLFREAERLARLGAWEYDVLEDAVIWSEGLLHVWGIARDAPRSLSATTDLIDPRDRPMVVALMRKSIEDGLEFDAEFRIRHGLSGEARWVRSRGTVVRDRDGRVLQVFGATQDITDEKEREVELRRARRHAREAERIAKLGAWELDLASRRLTWTEGLQSIFGLPGMSTVTEQAYLDAVEEEDRPRVLTAVAAATEEGRPLDVVHRIRRPDGRIVWIRTRGELERDASGTPVRLVGATQDVTRERIVEEALRESRQALEEFLDALTTVTAKLDASGTILHTSDRAEEMFGDVQGASWVDGPWWTYDADVLERARDAFTRASQGSSVRFTLPARVGDSIIVIDGWLSPVLDAERRVKYIVVEGHDVTELQRLQEDLRVKSERLARANADLEAFNLTVSHDLQAPLRGLRAYSQALLDDHGAELSAQGRLLVAKLHAECARMGAIIADLLSLARAGSLEVQRTRVDLSALAAEVFASLADREPGRDVDVRIAPDLEGHADPGLARILLENLLGNAWKFTGRRAQAIVEFGAVDGPEERRFFVRDNGVGFDPALATQLFRPFKRLDPQAGFEGTGIGLATVHRIVDSHGGRVWADARPGQGATFWFTLAPPRDGQTASSETMA